MYSPLKLYGSKRVGKNRHVRETYYWATPFNVVCRMSPNDIAHFCTVFAERNGNGDRNYKCRKRVQWTHEAVAAALYASAKGQTSSCCTAHKSIFIMIQFFFILFIYTQHFSLLITFLIKFYQLTKTIIQNALFLNLHCSALWVSVKL